ncbi:aldolase/citrate lyase family protein [Albibacillus kandeliae]|uniref:aldolase/citrate lyase family protein n=1 Tax=Albibacillus kandeliae TaxID=2174228 RepID=UPI000D69C938|nr:HpcH/HpaI aldolase/citrate lyase family protein [Albibacillus kandeliae]
MAAPINTFKQRLLAGETLIGCWLATGEDYVAEIMGTAGFDWLVIDGEHSPNDLRSIRAQLTALAASGSEPVVRVPLGETWMIKQVLDVGARTVLVPMVETAEQARQLVRDCRYPPEGVRGVGSALGRATMFNSVKDYVATANAQICLLVQVESRNGLEHLDEILAVEGVDGVFIGPADLATDMGHAGNSEAAEVKAAIHGAITRIAAAGKAPGILAMAEAPIQRHIDSGARFVAVGADVVLLSTAARQLAARWKG